MGNGRANGHSPQGRQQLSTDAQRCLARVILRMADKAQYSKAGLTGLLCLCLPACVGRGCIEKSKLVLSNWGLNLLPGYIELCRLVVICCSVGHMYIVYSGVLFLCFCFHCIHCLHCIHSGPGVCVISITGGNGVTLFTGRQAMLLQLKHALYSSKPAQICMYVFSLAPSSAHHPAQNLTQACEPSS